MLLTMYAQQNVYPFNPEYVKVANQELTSSLSAQG